MGVKILITPETGGWDVSALDGERKLLSTTWKPARDLAMRCARGLADFYRDIHGQPADIEWVK